MTMSPAGPGRVAPGFSIVIPTYQRRDLVARCVRALVDLSGPLLEVIVVVDGSCDGTAEMLRTLDLPIPLQVLEQANCGASKARNRGASLARGEVILFLDDDMIADSQLLVHHAQEYAAGADAVLGHIPVADDVAVTFLSSGLARWAEDRRARLAEPGGVLTMPDMLTGQLSIRRDVFETLGGFDERFTRDGSFGGEDTDLGKRLLDSSYRVVFAPGAVSWQHYAVSPRAYLRQWHQAGRADVAYLGKHPSEFDRVYTSRRPESRSNKYLVRPLARVPALSTVAAVVARRAAVELAERRPEDPLASRIFFKVRNLEYWRGVQAAGGLPTRRSFRVLCYHSVSDLRGAARIAQYGVPPSQLRRQLRMLRRLGFHFVTLDEVLRTMAGEAGLPRHAVLVTFDDCFVDLLEDASRVLEDEGVPAVAFAVAGLTGGSNSWDTAIGAPAIRLLDVPGLLELERAGVEIGVHGSTHRPLPSVDDDVLLEETAGAVAKLASMGLSPPRVFAYPHGAHDERTRRAVAAAGLQAAFTVTPGMVQPGPVDPFSVPRIEVLRRDGSGLRLLVKAVVAGRLGGVAALLVAPLRIRSWGKRLRNRASSVVHGAQTR